MEKFGVSQPVLRKEDVRLLTGHGRYVDDIAPEGAAHAFFLRSPIAHATFSAPDLTAARAAPGVIGVYAAGDLDGKMKNFVNAGGAKYHPERFKCVQCGKKIAGGFVSTADKKPLCGHECAAAYKAAA